MNRAVLAVAGGRKTQSIVDRCKNDPENRRILVLGYTTTNQDELVSRIGIGAIADRRVEVMGWFSFLMQHFVRPYLPLLYSSHKLAGLNFEGVPPGGYYAVGATRFLDSDDRAYMLHLAKLAHDVHEKSGTSVIDRLEHIYDEIYIDEVQDLGGWDLEIVEVLLRSKLTITMVGDMRQALLSTNARDPKNKKYRYDKIFDWFTAMEKKHLLKITQQSETYRSNQTIATFSDSIFDAKHGYASTTSKSTEQHEHVGLYAVREADATAYVQTYGARCLRHSAASGRDIDLPFENFGIVKGATFPHVLIYPTSAIRNFLLSGKRLEGKSACSLYIGVTRAQHSVAFILDQAPAGFTAWTPET